MGGTECDENVICKKLDISLGHVGMWLDEGEELSDVHGRYQISGVKDCTLDLKMPAGFVLSVVNVNHTLDFGGFDNWIESPHLICDLEYLSCDGFPRILRCWGKEIGVEALEEVTKTFGTEKVLVLHAKSDGKPHTVLVYLRKSVSRPHFYRCVPSLRGWLVCTS